MRSHPYRGGKTSRKRKGEGLYRDLKDALYLWIKEKNEQGVLPTNEMIIAKALSLALCFDIDMETFKAGQSWLDRFKSRFNNISWMKAHIIIPHTLYSI